MNVREVLRRYDLRPSKGLGQHFVVDEAVLDRIVEVSALDDTDLVLEIGPGLGSLTWRIAERAACVVAVELDRKLLPVLDEILAPYSNVHIVQGDILELDPADTLAQALPASPIPLRYKVVANLPYYITSAVTRHLLSTHTRPTEMTLLVQREVAQRIVAGPGDASLLAISVQVYGTPEIAFRVPRNAFHPRPKVDSAVLRIEVDACPMVPEDELDHFFRVARAGFAQRRKQLHNSLAHNLELSHDDVLMGLERAGISAERRAQTLSLEEWVCLARCLPD
ncbi:MAG: ribosomal RNA small subunit methyltransferase A [Anaerolineae bacterium]|nr:ribosomal RNA small subunit methyltransferase A [Anaerolineae bacterium]